MNNKHLTLHEVDMDELNGKGDVIDYYDGDIAIIDNLRDLSNVAPYYAKMNFIIICIKGKLRCHVNDSPIELFQGEILLSAPNVILDNYMISVDFECKILCLSDEIIQALLFEKIEEWNLSVYSQRTRILKLPDEDKVQFVYYYELIRYKLEHQDRKYRIIVMRSIIQALLYDVCSFMGEDTHAEQPAVKSQGRVLFNRFIKILSNKDIKRQPVGRYAYELNISPKYLSMICTKYSGKTASEWITQYTKEDVRFNLCHTNYSIKEISSMLGFPNISTFGTFVRHQFKVSPSTLRNSEKDIPREGQAL
jgi:AraC family transcriptional activator of pobA